MSDDILYRVRAEQRRARALREGADNPSAHAQVHARRVYDDVVAALKDLLRDSLPLVETTTDASIRSFFALASCEFTVNFRILVAWESDSPLDTADTVVTAKAILGGLEESFIVRHRNDLGKFILDREELRKQVRDAAHHLAGALILPFRE